ncbi:MAG TPA: hypothetical protein VIX13_05025 [Candidatus Eisenbacteria bacterium]
MRILAVLLLGSIIGCATAKEMIALRQVEFRFDRLSGARVAGIGLDRIHSYSDVTPVDLARLAIAVASKDAPLDLTVHIVGLNPETNTTTARLVAMDWAYLVDDRDIVSGRLTDPYTFVPGQPRDVPILVTFNLAKAFDGDAAALLNTALALAGQRTSEHKVSLRISPTVDTSLGPIRYPTPITIDLVAPAAR